MSDVGVFQESPYNCRLSAFTFELCTLLGEGSFVEFLAHVCAGLSEAALKRACYQFLGDVVASMYGVIRTVAAEFSRISVSDLAECADERTALMILGIWTELSIRENGREVSHGIVASAIEGMVVV